MTAIPAPLWPFRMPLPRRRWKRGRGGLIVPVSDRTLAAGDGVIRDGGNGGLDAAGNAVAKDANDECPTCCDSCCLSSCNCCYSPNSSWDIHVNTVDSAGNYGVIDEACAGAEGVHTAYMVGCEPKWGFRATDNDCAFNPYGLTWVTDPIYSHTSGGIDYEWVLTLGVFNSGFFGSATVCADLDTAGTCSMPKAIAIVQLALYEDIDPSLPESRCAYFGCPLLTGEQDTDRTNETCWRTGDFNVGPDEYGQPNETCCGSADLSTTIYGTYNGPYCCKEPGSGYHLGCRSATEAETLDCGFCDEGI
ncbi:hypothetical protein HED60_15045 [Planctomycetales bacterium ZRK34]|nr:hypothetical protein HED60_15045 [Planctomycetales bacterium ZRK34]